MAENTGRNPNRFKILPGELCAGAELGKDSCYGEGGFPLVCQSKEDKWHAVGIGKYKQNTVKSHLRPAGINKLEGFPETVLFSKMCTIQAAGKYYSRASIKCKIAVSVTTVSSKIVAALERS